MDTNQECKAHCLILPHPTQGHINPMLQFAKRLTRKRVKVTLALTRFLLRTTAGFSGGSISVRAISDGFDERGRAQAKSSEEYQARFQQIGQETLAELLQDLAGSGAPGLRGLRPVYAVGSGCGQGFGLLGRRFSRSRARWTTFIIMCTEGAGAAAFGR
ncbi:UNVERIFIED_CONTAM: Crocetin glucosyltransferase 2 [Sesamum angustifolium]|uniref:Crocetin glucosyltransferase 2 n=1 Tax=Sesamum angustifolium TaxID=2727405 RepID=A0AAW2MS31_9LAMI